jgi:hypothetical protein
MFEHRYTTEYIDNLYTLKFNRALLNSKRQELYSYTLNEMPKEGRTHHTHHVLMCMLYRGNAQINATFDKKMKMVFALKRRFKKVKYQLIQKEYEYAFYEAMPMYLEHTLSTPSCDVCADDIADQVEQKMDVIQEIRRKFRTLPNGTDYCACGGHCNYYTADKHRATNKHKRYMHKTTFYNIVIEELVYTPPFVKRAFEVHGMEKAFELLGY